MSDAGNKEIFSKNLSYYLALSGKEQKEVAEDIEVATSTFNDWVKGKNYPRIDKIEKLASYFGIKKSDLIEEHIFIKDKVNKTIAKNIKTFREDAKMSQTEFAQLLGVDEDTILNIENGNHIPNKEMLFLICDIFKTTPDFLNGTIEELYDSGDTDAEYRVLRYQQPLITTDLDLSEVEKILIELFRKLPDEAQKMYLEVLRTSLKSQS